jgi:CPA2 family monovalent cation:H+ antiporter-2
MVRTIDESQIEALRAAGATEVVPELIEGSLMLASHALALVGVPLNQVIKRVLQVREQQYDLLRGYFHGSDDSSGQDTKQDHLHSLTVPEQSKIAGGRIGESGLFEIGVRITAVRRRGIKGLDPSADMILLEGDVLIVQGSREQISQAETLVSQI